MTSSGWEVGGRWKNLRNYDVIKLWQKWLWLLRNDNLIHFILLQKWSKKQQIHSIHLYEYWKWITYPLHIALWAWSRWSLLSLLPLVQVLQDMQTQISCIVVMCCILFHFQWIWLCCIWQIINIKFNWKKCVLPAHLWLWWRSGRRAKKTVFWWWRHKTTVPNTNWKVW